MNIFDTKKNKIIEFKSKKDIGIYVCGITPYDSAHLGHIFTFMFYDLLTRWLTFKGHNVKLVRNITDVDEPIYIKAKELNIPYQKLAKDQTILFKKVMDQMNFLKPYKEPLASEYINEMSLAVKDIISKGYGYLVDKDVYFNTAKIKDFGSYFNIPIKVTSKLFKLRGGDPDRQGKINKLDFLLWKNIDDASDPARWNTDLGWGRPGWHIECSVMSNNILGNQFDLHGGGNDLIFPHHESEIAQSLALNNNQPARYWVHVAPLLLYGEKMSKSLGNLVFAYELLKTYNPDVIKIALMNYHYQVGGEWTKEYLDESLSLYNDLKEIIQNNHIRKDDIEKLRNSIYKALDNNLDTPEIIYCLKLFIKNSINNKKEGKLDSKVLLELLNLLGLYFS